MEGREPGGVEYPYVLYQDELTDGSFTWVAEHPDLHGVHGYGPTQAEALESLSHSLKLHLRALKRLGIEPSPPTTTFRGAVVEHQAVSGNTDGPVAGGWRPSASRERAVAFPERRYYV